MGLNTTWVCVKGADRASLLEAFDLVETGVAEGRNVYPAAVAELPDGWAVVHFDKAWRHTGEQIAAAFPLGEVLWGTCSETVMCSSASGLADGKPVWSIEHDVEQGRDDLRILGVVPADLDPIRERLLAASAEPENDEVDYLFEAPMELTAAVTGYDPQRQQSDLGFRVAEPRRAGAAGVRQAADAELMKRLAEAAATILVRAARDLGFRRAGEVKDPPSARVTPNSLVRVRGGLFEILTFEPGFYSGVAKIGLSFFVSSGAQDRFGEEGRALVHPRGRSFFELFTGRKAESPEAAFERAVNEALDLLPHVDRHLTDGTSHPNILPATYYDQPCAPPHR